MENNIKKWYMENYPTDELGEEINPKATFYGLIGTLAKHKDVYGYFEVGDSIIRERLFSELAARMCVDYDVIYNMWLDTAE